VLSVVGFTLAELATHQLRFGITLSSIILLIYFAWYELALVFWKKRFREKKLQEKIESLKEKEKDRLLEISRQGRESGMLTMGNLFIPTAFLMLGAAATAPKDVISPSARIVLAASGPLLYVLWLFLVQLSTRLMDDIDSDMRLAAKGGTANVLHCFYEDRHGFGLVMILRRNHWLAYVPLITIGAIMIIHSILMTS
jgi:hypothetical protein